jgi:hypothetical protein
LFGQSEPSIAMAAQTFESNFLVKGAKRRLRRSMTLDKKITFEEMLTIAIDGFL